MYATMWIWRVPILIFLSLVPKVLSCTYMESNDYYRNSYLCNNMTRNQYINKINTILHNRIEKLSIVQVNLPTIDQDVFAQNEYVYVHYLTIKQCGVTTIENHSFNEFKALEYLNILMNNIKHFDGSFITSLKYLNTLDISGNNIQQFNINCNNTWRFTKLIMRNNSITSLRKNTFQKCAYLQYLNMGNNKIDSIENNDFTKIENPNTLDLLNLTTTDIEPQVFFGLETLRSLNLSSNKIHNFSCDVFNGNNIQNLNLSNNEIENISTCMFQHLTKLKSLDLQNNRIKELQLGSLSALNQLQVLNLSHNELKTLSETVLHPLDSLQELDISANRFTVLDPRIIFSHLTTLQQVDLSGNLWSCHNLTSIRKYLRTKNISFKSKILNFTVTNIGGSQCVDEQNNEFEGGTVEYNDENKMSNKKNEITFKEFSQNLNNNLEKLVNGTNNSDNIMMQILNTGNSNSNNIGHIYHLLLTMTIIYVCYKVTYFCYKFYKQNKSKRKGSSTPTELITLNADIESI